MSDKTVELFYQTTDDQFLDLGIDYCRCLKGRFSLISKIAMTRLRRLGLDFRRIDIDYDEQYEDEAGEYSCSDMLEALLELKQRRQVQKIVSEVKAAPLRLEEAQDLVRPPSSLPAAINGDYV